MEFLLGVVFGAASIYLFHRRRTTQLRQVLTSFVEDEVEYMMINDLGDPDQQHNIKWARRFLDT